ncbi:hypothetical protein STXM2123_3472 [Streptomyces sp. F-3]|nr:hypothetical protein STXM2123_3472 [Streptomyces sp. F-3]
MRAEQRIHLGSPRFERFGGIEVIQVKALSRSTARGAPAR